MYVPDLYAVTDKAQIYDFIRDNGFGILFSHQGPGPTATHLPFVLVEGDDGQDTIIGHMARVNEQWKHADGQEVLIVFHGPHAYVSPTWYREEDVVPTWNYAVVHVYGTFEAVQGRAETVDIVSRIVDYYESFEPRAWTADFDSPYNRKMIRGVTAFRIKIARVEGKWKMGQNRPAYLRRRALEELQARPGENEQAVAQLMEETLDRNEGG